MNEVFTEKDIEAIACAFKAFRKVVLDAWENINLYLIKIHEVLEGIEYEERDRFKPVLKIQPNKIHYSNKRLINYYCRSNC